MMRLPIFLYGLLILVIAINCQQQQAETSSSALSMESEDFVQDSVFTSGVEGPAVSKSGDIYAVNYAEQGTIGKISPEGMASLFVKLPDSSIGNGIRFLSDGDMVIADYTRHNILRVDMETKEVRVWAHEPLMNQPNDLAVTSRDVIFASDPSWSQSTGQLWRVDADGSVTLLEAQMGTTNGIEVSPDEKRLYVNESVQRKVWIYDLDAEGNVSNKRLLIEFPDHGLDGMRCDKYGNLYITRYGKGAVVVVSPEGEVIREYRTKGKNTTNIAFGGPDGKTCYITVADRGNLETIQAEFPGRSQNMN